MLKKAWERLYNGLIRENPTFVLMLGMCPTLAVTTAAMNGIGMGLSTTAVLIMSNVMISALRNVIPNKVRMPAYIVIVATFVTIVQLLMQAYFTSLYNTLGIYIPLIVVNCIILGRAESYASKNDVVSSAFDGLGMGLGFTGAITIIGAVREVLSNGTVFGLTIIPENIDRITIFGLAPGAFFVLSVLCALQNKFKAPSATNIDNGDMICGGNCANCSSACRNQYHVQFMDQMDQKKAGPKKPVEETKSVAVEQGKEDAQ